MLLAVVFAAGLFAAPDVMAQATKTEKAPAKSTDKAAADKKDSVKGGKLDINTASEAELKALPGIGDAYAKKIVDNRPYKRKDEIVKKAGVPQATYDKIKEQIIAHQVKDDAKASAASPTTTKKKQ
jgi:DNA uptake protein ComE-like DNA-binding protein